MDLKDLEVYKLSRELAKECWEIYEKYDWQIKKVIGDQFITAIDSVGANIAEGFGRYHFLDKNKFNYNARGSLFESIHWIELLLERKKITLEKGNALLEKLEILEVKLNNYISSNQNQVIKNNKLP